MASPIQKVKKLLLIADGFYFEAHPDLPLAVVIKLITNAQNNAKSSEYGVFQAVVSNENITYIIGEVVIGTALTTEAMIDVIDRIFVADSEGWCIGSLRLLPCVSGRFDIDLQVEVY